MLTLQQLLESDSLSTVVAKLNQNFQSLSLSNGGPQGIRGAQGIPGLPGKQGQQGATGPVGATAGGVGIVPFACIDSTGPTAIGPAVDSLPSIGTVGPWPYSSWEWLQYYHVSGGAGYDGNPPQNQELYIDPANGGYWQYLETPDDQGATCDGGYTSGGAYSYTGSGVYPDLGATAGWGGPGWYWYPSTANSNAGGNLGDVWTNDYTTYLISPTNGGPYVAGPYFNDPSPLTIANARLLSKYGTVWITSGNDGLTDSGDLTETSTIGNWGDGSGSLNDGPQPGRNNAGVDRLLFKMSIDGLPYLSNIVARGYSGATAGTFSPTPSSAYPQDQNGDQMINGVISGYTTYWTSPQYNVNLGNYSPLLFLSHRDPSDGAGFGTYGSLGFYMYTSTDEADNTVPGQPGDPYGTGGEIENNNVSRTLHVMSSRYSTDPLPLYTNQSLDSSKTKNYGELVLDTRRVITSNQYVCSLPTDMKLSSDYRETGPARFDENSTDLANLYPYRTFQGYISAINGKSLTGDPDYGDFWEYGLGGAINGPAGGYTSGTHDQQSGTAGMQTRRAWYGSSVLNEKSSDWDGNTPGTNDYIRVAGMMERGRRINNTDLLSQGGTTGTDGTYFYSELIFYTSQFRVSVDQLINGVGVTNDLIDPNDNDHKSRPSLYVSPFRSIGIGTFAGGPTASNDIGPLEPSAKLHVHAKYTDLDDDPNAIYKSLTAGTGTYTNVPTDSFAVAAFTADGAGSRFTDIQIGTLTPYPYERISPNVNIVNTMNESDLTDKYGIKNAIRSESWDGYSLNTLRLGALPSVLATTIGRNTVNSYANEFQIAIHPLTTNLIVTATGSLESGLGKIAGVGIHALYPRARTHFFGRNYYNESEYGAETWTPGYSIVDSVSTGITSTYPYYGLTAVNSKTNNQVIIDYIGNSYTYPVGIKEYQYYSWGATSNVNSTGTISPNSAVYPNREFYAPSRYGIPYGGPSGNNFSYPDTAANIAFNGSYKHGGTAHAWLEPSSYIGLNLFRDLSSTDSPGNGGGDLLTSTWMLGTQGDNGLNNGNNGGAAIFLGSHGELCFATVPRGFDGGRAYEQWEQRGLGTRDILNQIKFIVDSHGAVGISNQPGWDYDAYSSLERDPNTGLLLYTPIRYSQIAAGTAGSPAPGGVVSYPNNIGIWNSRRFGYPTYNTSQVIGIPAETSSFSPAAIVNRSATISDYIRFEVAAEKAWSREGRSLQKQGYGYPPNLNRAGKLPIANYIRLKSPLPLLSPNFASATWSISTDSEGRIIEFTLSSITSSITPSNIGSVYFDAIVIPHPTEFNDGGPLQSLVGSFIAQPGAIAAEWWGMNENFLIDPRSSSYPTLNWENAGGSDWRCEIIFTPDTRGSANVRLNNFVYGEGYGFGSSGGQVAGLSPDLFIGFPGTTGITFSFNEKGRQVFEWNYNQPALSDATTYTQRMIKNKRQESPKLVLSFLEKNPPLIGDIASRALPDWAGNNIQIGTDPYRKVNTVIASAQNEAALREYWIPKSDNTGGTIMVFTDHMGSKEKDAGFDRQLTWAGLTSNMGIESVGQIDKLRMLEVVTMELVWGYTGAGSLSPGNNFVTAASDVTTGRRNTQINMGYVKYWNKQLNPTGVIDWFGSSEFGEKSQMPTHGLVMPGITYAGGTGAVYGVDALVGQTAGGGGIQSDVAIVSRNIDKYYSIWQSFNNSNWNDDVVGKQQLNDNLQATEIRFQRINSEFVLVDYNITVEVLNNPIIGGTGGEYIDGRVPRMTQALKFYYNADLDLSGEVPDGNEYRWTENKYGNGPWFSNWSSCRHWLPGSAVVGMDTNPLLYTTSGLDSNSHVFGHGYENTSYYDSPFFNYNNLNDAGTWPQTWTGNFIDAGYFQGETGPNGRIYPTFGYGNNDGGNFFNVDSVRGAVSYGIIDRGNPVHGMFDTVLINSVISRRLFFKDVDDIPQDREYFMSRIRAYYSVYLGQTMSRVRNTMWRVTPAYIANDGRGANSLGPSQTNLPQRNNTFVIEVMFDVPIMHCDHEFSPENFRSWDLGSTPSVQPYKYLTVTGQGIIRYAETYKST